MRVLVLLVMAFVNTFGITQPTPEGAERAARYLGFFLLVALAAAVAVGLEIRMALRR